MRFGKLAVFIAPVAFLALCADCAAQSDYEIHFTVTHRAVKRAEAVDFQGWTNYPDGALLFIGLSYMGTPARMGGAIVEKGRFEGSLEFEAGSLPTCAYDAEVSFVPQRQRANEFMALPAKRQVEPFMLGTPKQIEEFRAARLKELKKLANGVRSLYDPLRKTYKDYEAGSGFNARKWDDDLATWTAQMKETREACQKQRMMHAFMMFPYVEEGLLSFSEYLTNLPALMSDYLFRAKSGQSPGHVGMGPFIDPVDETMERMYTMLLQQIALKEKMGDEELIRAWLVKMNSIFDGMMSAFDMARNGGKKDDDPEWRAASEKLTAEQPALEESLKTFEKDAFFKEFPVLFEILKDVLSKALDTRSICSAYLGGTGDQDAFEAANRQYRGNFADIVAGLGLSGNVTTAPPVPEATPPVQLTPEIEGKIKAEIAKFATASDDECNKAIMDVYRYGNIVVPFLLDGLSGSNRKVALWCARSLPMYSDKRGMPALAKFYEKNREKEVLLVVLEAMGATGQTAMEDTVPFVIKQIDTADPDVKLACVKAIAQIRSRKFMPVLCDCLAGKGREILDLAVNLIQAITGDDLGQMGYSPTDSAGERKKFADDLKAYWRDQLAGEK